MQFILTLTDFCQGKKTPEDGSDLSFSGKEAALT